MKQKKINSDTAFKKSLKLFKLSLAGAILFLLLLLPFLTREINNLRNNFDSRSDASGLPEGAVIQSWVVSPNGGEVVYGNVPIQFFAKSSDNSAISFAFSLDLYKGNTLSKNLFNVGAGQGLTERNGIYTKYVDFTSFAESDDYRLKLTTSDAQGQGVVTDFSDSTFTISPNTSKPQFTSLPSSTNISVGQQFDYEVTAAVNSGSVKIVATSLPNWLSFNANKLSGKPTAEGIYSVSLVAINDQGRQTVQIFSINVSKVIVSNPKPTSTKAITVTPTQKPKVTITQVPVVSQPTPTPALAPLSSVVQIKAPAGNIISAAGAVFESIIPGEYSDKVTEILVELSKDGKEWNQVCKSKDIKCTINLNDFDGGDYFTRFTYTLTDGKQEVKNFGPIKILKQQVSSDFLEFKEFKPGIGDKTGERRPLISISFDKKVPFEIKSSDLTFTLDSRDLTRAAGVKLSESNLSYQVQDDLVTGIHTVKVEIRNGSEKIVKEWTFEVLNPSELAKQSDLKGSSTKIRILLVTAIMIVFLIFLLSIISILLSRKTKKHLRQNRNNEPPIL